MVYRRHDRAAAGDRKPGRLRAAMTPKFQRYLHGLNEGFGFGKLLRNHEAWERSHRERKETSE